MLFSGRSEGLAASLLLVSGLLHLLTTLLFFVFDDPVKVVEHVCISRLETEILLNFYLKLS